MARPTIVDLHESQQLAGSPPESKDQLLEAHKRAARAVRLLQNTDFRAWREDVEAGKARHTRQLIERTWDVAEANKKRGIIIALDKLFSELELQAAGLEEASRRLEEHEQRTKPVDHRQWWESLRSSGPLEGR